ncbi:MAG TPA: helix-turn-helix domain-containing protein [Planctomycetota bacterium]|nr:helix-turn-helix domain-containing protein [Planctomycetota bacterium]
MSPRPSYVLVADLAASRVATGRAGLSRTIEATLRRAARDANAWSAPPVTVKGLDEISAIVRRPGRVFDFAVALNLAVWPRRFRFALAAGEVDVAPSGRDAGAADGEAFHRAADALERAKAADAPFVVAAPGLAGDRATLIEALARLHGVLLADVPAGATPVLRALRAAPDATQARLARDLGMTQQAVSAALGRARASDLDLAEAALRAALTALPSPGTVAP